MLPLLENILSKVNASKSDIEIPDNYEYSKKIEQNLILNSKDVQKSA